jgi:GNAT superfamily N-acetyltransferase
MRFRTANRDDLQKIASIHTACWREVYAFMPTDVLKSRDYEYRYQQWARWFDAPDGVLLSIEHRNDLVGFCHAGRSLDPELQSDGEMRAGYLLPEYRGGLVGIGIMRHLSCWMLDEGMQSAGIWAFRENKYRHWYTHLGWTISCRRNRIIADHAIPEIAYHWDNLETLIHRLDFVEKITSERAVG